MYFRKIAVIIILFTMMMIFGCERNVENTAVSNEIISPFNTYKDIPGLSPQEILSIESLLSQRAAGDQPYFTYGMLYSAETFLNEEGEVRGYTALVCQWLSELFGVDFIPEILPWGELFEGLGTGLYDFTGTIMATEERFEQGFFMTSPIALRWVEYFRLNDSEPIHEIQKTRLPRYALLANARSAENALRQSIYEFEPVYVSDYLESYELLKNGEVDALLAESSAEAVFDVYGDIVTSKFFPLIYSAVSLSTRNARLEPIINAVQKAMDGGGNYYLSELYDEGKREYRKNKMVAQFTPEEMEFIENNPVILLGVEYDNYPVSFYSERQNEWQGIALDVIEKIIEITGLEFKIVNDNETEFYKLLEMLRVGEIHILTEVIKSPARQGQFLWPENSFMTEQSVLISTLDLPNIEVNKVYSMKVGLSRGNAHSEFFHSFIPNHTNTVLYENQNETRDALVNGEIDMMMSNYSTLLAFTNYEELPNFKANVIFNNQFNSTFGINKDQEILLSIIDKSLSVIDTNIISEQWLHRNYDYTVKLLLAQRPWMIGASVLAVFVLILAIAFLLKSRYDGRKLENIVGLRTATLTVLFNSIPDLLYTKDLDLKFTHVNTAMLEYYGLKSEDIIGKKQEEIWMSDDLDKDYDDLNLKVINEKQMIKLDESIKHKDGSTRIYETIRLPIMVDGSITSVLGIARDITKRKEMDQALEDNYNHAKKLREAAEAASNTKSEFLANMSHEIRTPMNSIIGFSELALDDNLSPETKDYLGKIHENAKGLLLIINDILDLSKIESGKMEMENIPFDMQDLLTSCRSLIIPKAIEKNLVLHFYAEPSLNLRPLGDPVRLRQVLVNLLSNAVKFTNVGTVKLFVQILDKTDKSITMSFEVKDSGIGMTNEQIERIFDPFTQAETGTTRKFGGTGLGLSITKKILESMGGTINVESTPGVGSKFSFVLTFDAIDVKDDEFIHKVTFDEYEKPTFEGEVLLCEDNIANQQVICGHLSRVGLNTVIAENGKIGVDMVKSRVNNNEKQFDLIFMDMHMPVMDGLEATAKILELKTNIPIVALTANIMSDDREVYKTSGIVDYVGKPFTSQELWRCLMRFFTPINWKKEDKTARLQEENELQQKLINNFVHRNRDIYNELNNALNTGDIKLAHRLAHTLKSEAANLGKTLLQKTAEIIENQLINGENNVSNEQMLMFKNELDAVIIELSPLVQEKVLKKPALMLDKTSARKLLEELEPFLKRGDPECLSFSEKLTGVSGSDELITKMESFNFDAAMKIFMELKAEYEGS